ncbi:MAG: hypothetical protein DRP79_08770, partial [Planctomycetota bacterium]
YNPYVGNKTPAANDSFAVYPNPAQNDVTINTAENIKSVTILSFKGETIKTFSGNQTKTQKINISSLNTGIYFVKTSLKNGKIKTTKLIKN